MFLYCDITYAVRTYQGSVTHNIGEISALYVRRP
jgi:hypothetical protein